MQPTIITIFGATGDLTARKLIPALYHLAKMDNLPSDFTILAVARRPLTDQQFTDQMKAAITQHYRHGLDQTSWQKFAQHITYHQLELHQPDDYDSLAQTIDRLSHAGNSDCANRLFYLAINPAFTETTVQQLERVGLHQGCSHHNSWSRVILEKPFGTNQATAHKLNQLLSQRFDESQIYRIDHYLGKETVQNILAFRFANGLFEPTWCRDYIDNIQITVAETVGVEQRGEYYDNAGALRDVAQNHLLQILSLIAMDEPASLKADDIRNAKSNVLSNIIIPDDILFNTVKGQYVAKNDEEESTHTTPRPQPLISYKNEPRVNPDSTTETFVAFKLNLNLDKWRDIPFYLRTGKRLQERVTEVNVEFKKLPADLFGHAEHTVVSNVLTLRIQPNEGISLRMSVKKPGLKMELQPVRMEFCYRQEFEDQPDAYERLLLDCLAGDQTLFLRSDEVEQSWQYIDAIEQAWQANPTPPHLYSIGSWGPSAADDLIAQDGRQWLSHQIATCPIR